MSSISDSEGEALVKLARTAVTRYLEDAVMIDSPDRPEKAGVFVTLNYLTRNKEEHLRGCIGFPLPEKKLYLSVIEAAVAAATEDPRFPPVDKEELRSIIFEVSVLTVPQEITGKPDSFREQIRIGKDGLMLRWKHDSGLLLPQVPVELNWDADDFLANICYKAGAPPDAWLDPSSKLYKFQAIIFKEKEPDGAVVRIEPGSHTK